MSSSRRIVMGGTAIMGEDYKSETVRLPSDEDFQTVSEEKRLCDVHFWNFCRKLKTLARLVGKWIQYSVD